MKIRYLSDLHLEFKPAPEMESVGEDVVVLAGDIDQHFACFRWARQAFPKVPVLYVFGNHEFYGIDFDRLRAEAPAKAAAQDIHLLDPGAVTIGGVRFLGATLWTDFAIGGQDHAPAAMELAGARMNDYHYMYRKSGTVYRKLIPHDTLELHRAERGWLEREIAASTLPTVVISHHGPFRDASAAQYRDDPLAGAFNSDLTALMQPPVALWIFGHTHYCVDQMIGSTRVVSNQRGYPRENTGGFRWDRCVELDVERLRREHRP